MIESREGEEGGHVGSSGGGVYGEGVMKSRASKWLRQG